MGSSNGFGFSFGSGDGTPSAQLRQDLQNMIQNILVFGKFPAFGTFFLNYLGSTTGMNPGNFNMADFAWGENGLDDIITQVIPLLLDHT